MAKMIIEITGGAGDTDQKVEISSTNDANANEKAASAQKLTHNINIIITQILNQPDLQIEDPSNGR